MHDYITRFLPYLDSKELDINMAGYFSGNNGVHNINSRIIVFINWSIRFPWKPKLPKHIPQNPRILVRSYSRNNICFRGTQSIDRWRFRPVHNCIPVKCKSKSNSGYSLGRLISMCRVYKIHQFYLINVLLGFGGIFPYTTGWYLGSGISSRASLLLYIIPQYLVIRAYLARFFGQLQ